MYVKFILPALTEAKSKYWRPIKYSLFPPLGLALLAGYLTNEDNIRIIDEHVDRLTLDDRPDLVAIEVYVTSAYRAYEIADYYRKLGVYVVMGGLHVTALPNEALQHADTIVCGPAEEAWPRFLNDFRAGRAQRIYYSITRTLNNLPKLRRDLINRRKYLVPNSIVVSRGCPHNCDFCYKESFFKGGTFFYTCNIDRVLAEIETLPGRHLFFLDDNIFGNRSFAYDLFRQMRSLKRIWQGAATLKAVLDEELLDCAVESGLRSLFVGFETLNEKSLTAHNKNHNRINEYERAVKMLHERSVMINASFVFGMEGDDKSVFNTTVDWAIRQGMETSTFHILTPHPGTRLYDRYIRQNRIISQNWDLYDTRHAVFQHPVLSTVQLEEGYWQAYRQFYRFSSILRSSTHNPGLVNKLRHFIYTTAWKKMEWLWPIIIHIQRLDLATPLLESVLNHKKDIKSNAKPALLPHSLS